MSKYQGRIITDLAPAGYSVYFDGSNDRLIIANTSSAFPTGTQEFTLEFWAYKLNAWNTNDQFLFQDSATAGLQVWVNTAGGIFRVGSLGVAGIVDYAYSNLSINTWTHFAISRKVNSWALWVNGTRVATATYSSGLSSAVGTQTIGGASGSASWNGYISNVRIVRGTTVYDPASTTINVPTQLFVVPSTTLLTCNSPAIVDQSNNAFAITVNDNAAVSTLTPFTAYVPYNPALGAATPGVWTVDEAMQAAATRQWNMYDPYFNLTTLLLHGNGANNANNNTFLDSSSNNFTITRNGNTTQGSFSPFSQTGWSNYFDGTGDFLNFASSASFGYGTGDYTIEGWVWSTTRSVANTFFANGTDNCNLYIKSSTGIIGFYTGSVNDSTTALPLNQWNHIAVVRNGSGSNNTQVYLNGTSILTITNTTNFSNTTFFIGRNGASGSEYMNGYISNVRVTKGRAVYTSSFTPPASPLGKTSGGQNPPQGTECTLLTCQSNRFVDNSDAALTVTPNADSSVQPFSPFYPTVAYTPQTIGGSGYFDGTGDYLTAANNAAFNLSTNDFTLELFWYPTTFQAGSLIESSSASNYAFAIYAQSSGAVQFYAGTGASASWNILSAVAMGTATLNAWNHIVVVRSGTTFSYYLNGTRSGQSTSVSASIGQQAIGIGANSVGSSVTGPGYISGARLINGTALYSGTTLTIPTAPLTAVTNTSLLLNFANAGVVDSTGDNVLETVGNASISTTVSRFGGSSIAFDGTGDYAYAISSVSNSALGSGDWTVEFWLYTNVGSTTYNVIDWRPFATQGAYFTFYLNSGVPTYYTSSADRIVGGSAIPATTWTHVAVSRSGTSTRMFINGTQSGSTYTDSATYLGVINRPAIGGGGSDTGNTLNGYIDDLRVTRFARYTGNFTPQTSQWQDQ